MGKTTLAQYLAAGCRKYGYQITELEYRALYRAQGGRCLICRRASGKAKRLAVDHNHLTGEVRGLVCSGSLSANTCNRLIALYNREQLLRAAAMLFDPPPARAVLTAVRAAGESAILREDPMPIPSVVGGDAFDLYELRRDDDDLG